MGTFKVNNSREKGFIFLRVRRRAVRPSCKPRDNRIVGQIFFPGALTTACTPPPKVASGVGVIAPLCDDSDLFDDSHFYSTSNKAAPAPVRSNSYINFERGSVISAGG